MSRICRESVNYLAVVSQYMYYADVLNAEDYQILRISNEALKSSNHVPLAKGMPRGKLTGITLNYNRYIQTDKPRIYLCAIRTTRKNTRVILPDFNEMIIPNEELGKWYTYGTMEFCRYMDHLKYPDGRKLEDMTFGIEFEFMGLDNKEARKQFITAMKSLVGEDRVGEDGSSPNYWNLDGDPSIHEKSGMYGYELQSRVLYFTGEDFRELKGVLDLVKEHLKGEVDASCGTHVHFGNFYECMDNYEMIWANDSAKDACMQKFKQLSQCYGQLERTVFDRLIDWSRRRNNNDYCQSCVVWKDERERKINLECFTDDGSLENRHHHGTLDAEEIWHWMEVIGRFVLKFFEDNTAFDGIEDIQTFFDIIGLDQTTKQYYKKYMEELNETIRQQVEKRLNLSDYRDIEDRGAEPDGEIHIGFFGKNQVKVCA